MRPYAIGASLLAGTAIGVLSMVVLHGQPSNQVVGGPTAASLTQLQGEVASLTQAVDLLRQASITDVELPKAVRLDDARDQEILKAVARVEERLALLAARLDEVAETRLLTEPPTGKPQDFTATAQLRDAATNAGQDVITQHFCWSPVHVYRKYGLPNSVTRSGQSIRWVYYPDDSDHGVELTFEDGVVTRVGEYKSPNPRR